MTKKPQALPIDLISFRAIVPEHGFTCQDGLIFEYFPHVDEGNGVRSYGSFRRKIIDRIPANKPGLFMDFANLDLQDEKQIVAFANSHGLLTGRDKANAGPCESPADKLRLWQEQIFLIRQTLKIWNESINGGNPLRFLWQGNKLFYFLGETDADIKKLRETVFRDNLKDSDIDGFFYPIKKTLVDIDKSPELAPIPKENYRFWTKLLIKKHFNETMLEFPSPPQLIFNSTHGKVSPLNEFSPYITPQSLISLLWLQLLQYISDKKPVRQCPDCGDLFPGEERWHERCDTCGTYYRQQKFQARKLFKAGATIEELIKKRKNTTEEQLREWVNEFQQQKGDFDE